MRLYPLVVGVNSRDSFYIASLSGHSSFRASSRYSPPAARNIFVAYRHSPLTRFMAGSPCAVRFIPPLVIREEDPDFSAGAPGAEAESISAPNWLTTAEIEFVR